MDKTHTDSQAMSGTVQGFELPTGCLMTSVLILLPIVVAVVALIA